MGPERGGVERHFERKIIVVGPSGEGVSLRRLLVQTADSGEKSFPWDPKSRTPALWMQMLEIYVPARRGIVVMPRRIMM